LNCPPPKRKLDPESNSTNDEDLQLPGNNSSQLLRQLESKNQEVEELKSQVQKLQQQYEQVLSCINGFEHRLRHIETMNQDVPRHVNNPKQYSREMEPSDPNIDKLTKDFEERVDLVESNSQALTERLDSCQQKFSKMTVKTESFENQLVNLQQRFNNFEIHDTNMQSIEIIPTQQLAEEDTYQNPSTTVKTKLTDDMNTPKGTVIHHSNHTKKWVHLFLL
jgi:prefoldin subunit 5